MWLHYPGGRVNARQVHAAYKADDWGQVWIAVAAFNLEFKQAALECRAWRTKDGAIPSHQKNVLLILQSQGNGRVVPFLRVVELLKQLEIAGYDDHLLRRSP